MNKVIIGLVIFAVGLWALVSWWWFVMDVIKALFAIILILSGLTLVGLGVRNKSPQTHETK